MIDMPDEVGRGLTVLTRVVGGWAVVHVGGEVDLRTAATLRCHLVDAVEKGHRRLVLDLDRVEFLDSTGIAVLVATQHRVRACGGELRLVCTGEGVRKPLRVTGLLGAFAVYSGVDAALDDQSPRSPSQ